MNYFKKNLQFLCNKRGLDILVLETEFQISKGHLFNPEINDLIKIAAYFNLPIDVIIKKDLEKYSQLNERNIKLVILDVDGTMTDGGMYFMEDGNQMKRYNTRDGIAIKQAIKKGIMFGIISHGAKLNVVKNRANLLGIQLVYVGNDSKVEVLKNWLNDLKFSPNQVAFIGDDINDIEIMKYVGLSACPANAVNEVKPISDIILNKNGGEGCIREFFDDWLLGVH